MAYSSPYAPDHLPNDLILDTSRWQRRSRPWEVTWGHNQQPGLAGDSAQGYIQLTMGKDLRAKA